MNGKKSCPKTSRPAYNTGSCTTTALSLLARADADVAEAAPREVPGLARVRQQHGAGERRGVHHAVQLQHAVHDRRPVEGASVPTFPRDPLEVEEGASVSKECRTRLWKVQE